MDKKIEQFLRDILVEDMDHREIRNKALDLFLSFKEQTVKTFSYGMTNGEYDNVVSTLRTGFYTGVKKIREITNCGFKIGKDFAEEILKNEKMEKIL